MNRNDYQEEYVVASSLLKNPVTKKIQSLRTMTLSRGVMLQFFLSPLLYFFFIINYLIFLILGHESLISDSFPYL
jgi:hypothetical protein